MLGVGWQLIFILMANARCRMGTRIHFHAKKFTTILLKEKKELCSTHARPKSPPDQNPNDKVRYKAHSPYKGCVIHDKTMHLTDEYALNTEVYLKAFSHWNPMRIECVLRHFTFNAHWSQCAFKVD